MAFNSRGEMNCWIFPALVSVACFSPLFSSVSKPPPRVSVQHPIVRDIQPQCENQQMGNFVCMAAVDVDVCVRVCMREERGVRQS